MQRTRVLVAATRGDREPLASALARTIREAGLDVWRHPHDVRIGMSLSGASDEAVELAQALVLVGTPDPETPREVQWLTRACIAQLRLGAGLQIILLHDQGKPIPASLRHLALVLPILGNDTYTFRECLAILSSVVRPNPETGIELPFRASGGLRLSAWTHVETMHSRYGAYVALVRHALAAGEYESALEWYWRILHYTGFQERWHERLELSALLLPASIDVRDTASAADIAVKGIAYAKLETGQLREAVSMLKTGFRLARGQHARPIRYACWAYLADEYAKHRRYADALRCYDEAAPYIDGDVDAIQLDAKRELLQVSGSDCGPARKELKLNRIRDQFAGILDYREFVVDIHIAAALLADAPQHAVEHAERAARSLGETLGMQRNAVLAQHILARVRRQLD